jgi:hypothetical protein
MHVRPPQSQRFPDPQPAIPKQDHREAFTGPPTAAQHRLDLLVSQRFRERCLRPRFQGSGSHRAELAGLAGVEPWRGEA